jgi:hydrogenase/urease accessory protein HupE
VRPLVIAALLGLFHDESISSSRIHVGARDVTVTFAMSREDAASIAADAFGYVRERFRISNDGAELAPELVRAEAQTLVMRYRSARDIGALKVRCEVFRDKVKRHRHVADFPDGRTIVFEGAVVEADWSERKSSIGRFVLLGVEHILTGWDHLVFLLSLLLIATRIKRVVQLVTAFTVAHSVTLGLVALHVIAPASWLVEAIIAASIVYVAVENWFVKEGRWRWVLVFAFGLVHGMGFGGILLEMELARPAVALVGFNLGVELGQLLVVALVYPLLALLRRREEWYQRWVVRGLSGAAAAVGVFWLVQRLAG